MKKFYSEVTLLNQLYILDNDKSVNEIIKEFSTNNEYNLIKFSLFVLGS